MPVKSKVKISQKLVAFSEYMTFTRAQSYFFIELLSFFFPVSQVFFNTFCMIFFILLEIVLGH